MDWMYNANNKGVNQEEYLLGKKVDSAILDSQKDQQQEGASGSVAVDMANKIREDPLFAIKQKEAAKRKALLENPIRLKQLQEMLQSQVGHKSKKSKKKEKKSKKEKKAKKSHHRQSSESSSGSEDDENLDAKLMEKLRGKAIRENEVKDVLKGSQYGLIGGKSSSRRVGDRKDSESRRDRERHSNKRDDESRRNQEDERKRHHRTDERRHRSRSPAERQERKRPSKMSQEELEERRKEMMDNAKWRDEQRKTRVDRYKVEDAREDEMEKKKSRKQDFFNPLKVTSHSSVEDRIKRNIHNIQRTRADLDKNFAKR